MVRIGGHPMRKRNIGIAVVGAAYAMAILAMPAKVSVHAAANEYTPGEELADSITINNYYGKTLNNIAAEVFDTYTSSADKRNAEETEVTALTDKYKNIGIADVEDYLNVREEANENSEIVGTLAKDGGCYIYSVDEDGWAKIKSGEVTGYVLSKYLVTGEEVPSLVEEVGTKMGTVTTETVRLRGEKSTDGITLNLISIDQQVKVLNDSDDEWVRVKYDGDKGYVAKEYLTIDYTLETAKPVVKEVVAEVTVSTETNTAPKTSSSSSASSSSSKTSSTSSKTNSNSSNTSSSSSSNSSSNNSSSSSSATSSVRSRMVSYAKQFLGGKYVYGGTSLTSGTDCSGFTMRIYEHFGYSISRTSRSQASAGRTISVSSVKPGDLVFYTSGGSINHVAMYIGGGQVIHASNPESGIKTSNMNYRTPYKAVRFIND